MRMPQLIAVVRPNVPSTRLARRGASRLDELPIWFRVMRTTRVNHDHRAANVVDWTARPLGKTIT
jgi:hypothetical protein